MEHKETGCQAPEGPILCTNNCGFFGSAATMNLCSKCHKELVLKQQQADLAASSIDSILNGGGSSSAKAAAISTDIVTANVASESKIEDSQSQEAISLSEDFKLKSKDAAPNRCNACKKRVGLMGFNCRCGNIFCSAHRYSDKHGCPFDYQKAARDAIAKANPVVKAEKLDKI